MLKNITIKLPQELIDEIDELIKSMERQQDLDNVSRSTMIRRLVRLGIQNLKQQEQEPGQ